MKFRNYGKLIPVLLLVLSQTGVAALAAESPSLAIYPSHFDEADPRTRSWFIYNLKAGETLNDEVVVQNKGSEAVSLDIYPVDASANMDGAFTLSKRGTTDGVGGWLKLASLNVTLAPRSKVTVPFTLKVPLSAAPGDHVGGIAVEPRVVSDVPVSGVRMVQRVGVRFYIGVKGERREQITINKVAIERAADGDFLRYEVVNSGNVNVALSGAISIGSVLGSKEISLGNLGEVLAGKTVVARLKLPGLSPFAYSLNLAIEYGGSQKVAKNIFVNPRPEIVLFPAVLALILAVFLLRKKYRRV